MCRNQMECNEMAHITSFCVFKKYGIICFVRALGDISPLQRFSLLSLQL